MNEDQELMLPISSRTFNHLEDKKIYKLPKNEEHTINNSHLPCINSSVN